MIYKPDAFTRVGPRTVVAFAAFLMLAPRIAMGGYATFDSLAEGFYEDPLTDGGITFFDVDARRPTGGNLFAVDDVSVAYSTVPGFVPFFSSPNVLGMTAFGPGPIVGGSAQFGELKMTTGQVENFASVDVFHFEVGDFTFGNSIVLEGFLGGVLVASDSILLPEFSFSHDMLTISDVDFDTLRLAGEGPSSDGIFFGAIDNVAITPEPSALVLLGLSSLLVLPRRRSRRQPSRSRCWRASRYLLAVGALWFSDPSASAQCTGTFNQNVPDFSDLFTSPGCSQVG